MTVEALWTAEFELFQRGWTNFGIVVLESSRIFGGDGQYYYVGHYTVDANKRISASMRATHYNGPISTAFGTNERVFELNIDCQWDGTDSIIGLAQLRRGGPTLHFRMIKRSNLP